MINKEREVLTEPATLPDVDLISNVIFSNRAIIALILLNIALFIPVAIKASQGETNGKSGSFPNEPTPISRTIERTDHFDLIK